MTAGGHAAAVVSAGARIAEDVSIGPFSVVHDNVEIERGTVIGSHCVIGQAAPTEGSSPLRVGANSRIRSHSVLYEGSSFGPQLETGHHVTMREGIEAGVNLRVGTNSDLQGRMRVGEHVRIHSRVFVGELTTLEDFVWVFPGAVFTNDPHPPSDGFLAGAHVESYAAIGAAATLLPGVRVGSGSLVAAHSLVTRDVAPGEFVAGVPAKSRGPASQIQLRDASGRSAYPWRRHFHRGYPADVVARWESEFE